jgi:hypothetical protein
LPSASRAGCAVHDSQQLMLLPRTATKHFPKPPASSRALENAPVDVALASCQTTVASRGEERPADSVTEGMGSGPSGAMAAWERANFRCVNPRPANASASGAGLLTSPIERRI